MKSKNNTKKYKKKIRSNKKNQNAGSPMNWNGENVDWVYPDNNILPAPAPAPQREQDNLIQGNEDYQLQIAEAESLRNEEERLQRAYDIDQAKHNSVELQQVINDSQRIEKARLQAELQIAEAESLRNEEERLQRAYDIDQAKHNSVELQQVINDSQRIEKARQQAELQIAEAESLRNEETRQQAELQIAAADSQRIEEARLQEINNQSKQNANFNSSLEVNKAKNNIRKARLARFNKKSSKKSNNSRSNNKRLSLNSANASNASNAANANSTLTFEQYLNEFLERVGSVDNEMMILIRKEYDIYKNA